MPILNIFHIDSKYFTIKYIKIANVSYAQLLYQVNKKKKN